MYCFSLLQIERLMVVGIDTFHDTAKKGRSVGGFVASLNKTLTRYYSQATLQMSSQELIDTLKVSLTSECFVERVVSIESV